MKDEETTQGFSFLLSASAPPAEVTVAPRDDRGDPSQESSWLTDIDDFSSKLATFDSPLPAPTTQDEVPTRTPAPAQLVDLAHDENDGSQADGCPEGLPPQPAVKRISFPKGSTTVFSKSVSQAPRARLDSDDGETLEPEDLPESLVLQELPRAPQRSELAQQLWRSALHWSARGTQQATRLLQDGVRTGARWTLRQGRTAGVRLAGAWRKRETNAAARKPLETSGDDLAPLVEEASQSARPVREKPGRLRSALSASAALTAAGVCYFAVGYFLAPTNEDSSRGTETPLAQAVPTTAAADSPTASPGSPSRATANKAASSGAPAVEQVALPEGLSWPGKGLIEVVTGGRELIYVDGVFTGRGPLRRIPVTPGPHEVILRTETTEQKHTADVVVDRRTRLVFGADQLDQADAEKAQTGG